jgi:hypothetical protein
MPCDYYYQLYNNKKKDPSKRTVDGLAERHTSVLLRTMQCDEDLAATP